MNRMNNCNSRNCVPAKVVPVNECVIQNRTNVTSFPLAMAYVPKQYYSELFDLSKGLSMGTIFPELCLPFCGVRGNCPCKIMK